MIDHKFLYFKTLQGFENAKIDRGDGNSGIRHDSIVFIGKEKLIWNRGIFYGGSQENNDSKNKGLFESNLMLTQSVRSPKIGDWAVVRVGDKWYIHGCNADGVWTNTGNQYYMGTDSSQIESLISQYQQVSSTDISQIQSSISNIDKKYKNITDDLQSLIDSLPTQQSVDSQLSLITSRLADKVEYSDLADYVKTPQVRSLINDRILEVVNALQQGDGTYNIREEIIEEKIHEIEDLIDQIDNKYISWGVNEPGHGEYGGTPSHAPSGTISSMVTLSDVEYQNLLDSDEINENFYYFVYSEEDYPSTWTFGHKFPVTFTEQNTQTSWKFGDKFPITFTEQQQWTFGGTFPITLQ